MEKTGNIYAWIKRALLWILFSGIVFSSCEDTRTDRMFLEKDVLTIFDYVNERKEIYSYFWQIMRSGDMSFALTAYNPGGEGFTLFLPTDEAFERYVVNHPDYTSFDELLADRDFIRVLGRYHLVNRSLNTNDFPYGALPDTTATGDFLTIGFSTDLDSTYYKVNNIAPVEIPNIRLANGFVHVISEVLDPIAYSSYEWLQRREGFSILAGLFELTGLSDTMGIYRSTRTGQIVRNRYTILAEHDSIFHRNQIHSLDDLINKYNTPGKEFTDPDNQLYQFAAYHILEGSYFLDEFSGSMNYNTYASFPVHINAGMDIRINAGVDTFGFEIRGSDTVLINYIRLNYQESNQLTKNGPVHALTEVMNLFRPSRSVRTFQFWEEPRIFSLRTTIGTHSFVDPEMLEVIKWQGPDEIFYVKAGPEDRALSQDYLLLNGSFTIEYTIPRLIPGRYRVELRANAFSQNNATIQVFIDDRKIGANIDLTTGGTAANPYVIYTLGEVDFSAYIERTVRVRSLIPGQFIWDYVRFTPV